MEIKKTSPEYAPSPPERDLPAGEYRPAPELEFAAPPPEFGQRSGPVEEPEKKRRYLRNLLLIPLLFLLGFLLFHPLKNTEPPAPELPTGQEPTEPPAVSTEPVPIPEPELTAELALLPGGDAEFHAHFLPAEGDSHAYDLHVHHMTMLVYGELPQSEGFSFGGADPRTLPVVGDPAGGYTVTYEGASAAAMMTEGQECAVVLELIDNSTGKLYEAESNRCPAPEPTETEATYPLGDGTVVITIYNDTMIFDVPSPVEMEDYRTILAVDSIPEAEFTEYVLPEALPPEGYDFAGWVIHVNNPLDFSAETDLFAEYMGDPPVELLVNGDNYAFPVEGTLTRAEIERVPPNEEGLRFVNVHAVWIRRDPTEIRLLLDDGAGNVTEYGMDHPCASEGYLYLCNYPVPEREGLVFDGWYDDDGNRVDLLVSFFSFTPMTYDEDGQFAGYDWSGSLTVHLTARWKPA